MQELIGLEIYDCRAISLLKHPEFELSYLLLTSHLWRWTVQILYWLTRHGHSLDSTIRADATLRATLPLLREFPLVA